LERFVIEGGKPLSGSVRVQGSKNATLPILAATVLAEGIHQIENVPGLTDIFAMCKILESLGAEIVRERSTLYVDTRNMERHCIPEHLMRQIRSSVFLMGPLLSRLQRVRVTKPGGCNIGARPIDLHLKGLAMLGTEIVETDGIIQCEAPKLTGTHIPLEFPSVGATENIMMAAVCAEGETIIENAACEPEIVELATYLTKMGAQIEGAGTPEIRVIGVDYLTAASHQVMSDRIAAGTFAIASAITGGKLVMKGIKEAEMEGLAEHLEPLGVHFSRDPEGIRVKAGSSIRPASELVTKPFPGFPTDMQPQTMVLLALAEGESRVTENIFERRLKHVHELKKMGADMHLNGRTVTIRGVKRLKGAEVFASDLRSGAALVIAGLAACGRTIVHGVHHIDRGYEPMEETFGQLGGNIKRIKKDAEQ
jgi:UDP-N-acetylglucosamine 1-carboxyvinyltransferase